MSITPCKLLLVDDEPAVLDALRRSHRKQFDLSTAVGAEEALAMIDSEGPFDVVVSDYQMPVMNGAVFLSKVARRAPDCVRMMLTGNADLKSAVEAVNTGQIFRFMTKPCSPATFVNNIEAAMEQVRLRRAEKELLEETLTGSIEVLSEILALTHPEAFGRANRVRRYVEQLVVLLEVRNPWKVESAALLSQIGCVALPPDLLSEVAAGAKLTQEQADTYERHPGIAARLLGQIPRLEDVARIVQLQRARYADLVAQGDVPSDVIQGSQVLAACLQLDELLALGADKAQAIMAMAKDEGAFDPRLLRVLARVKPPGDEAVSREVGVSELRAGMLLDQDVRSESGRLIVSRGHRITASLVERLTSYHRLRGVDEPIRVLVFGQGRDQAA